MRENRYTGKIWRTATTTLLFSLAGCSVGPNFQPPENNLPQSWLNQKEEAPQNTVNLSSWWSSLGDPILTSLIERALTSNLDIAKAKQRVIQAKASRRAVASGFWPFISLSGDATRGRGSSINEISSPIRESYQAGLDLSWEIDLFGGIRREVEASEAETVRSFEELSDVQVSLLAEVATHYLSLRGLQTRLKVANDNVELQTKSRDIAKKRYDVGFEDGLDLSQAEGALASTEAQVPSLLASIREEIYTISVLLGTPPGTLLTELELPVVLPETPQSVAAGLPSDLLLRRPDIRAAEAALHAETARIGVTVANFLPKLNLGAGIGLQGPKVEALNNWEDYLWNLGASAVQPLFDGGERDASLTRQKAIREESLLEYRRIVLNALQEVEVSLTSYEREGERRTALLRSVAANERAVKLAQAAYSAGTAEFIEVLTAERSLYSSQDSYTISTQTQLLHLVSLYKALGGGW